MSTTPPVRALSAHTKEFNTPESDRQARVWHVVKDTAGNKHEVYAKDPGDAIDMVNDRLKENS
jgi:hypothetical protein